ncbi:BON domain-containing protein [Azotobacter salinestris]|uniref:BON domain-containing protein n=1 Tax=Azotobacter salinestris TaxID=69964 RepID=UPI0012669ED3|nr:BON domain-containing protein [Azotobacter salinestris]
MKRSLLIMATLATSLILGGCSNRSIGNTIDDQFIEPKVAEKIRQAHADLGSDTSHIVVTTYNSVTLLAGQTPRTELKQLAEQAALSVPGVTRVHNEIQILSPTSLLARSNDSLLTTKIKTQMLADNTIPGSKIKVITENGIVYLMGLITRQEANRAASLVQGISGVQKVVKLFQYAD